MWYESESITIGPDGTDENHSVTVTKEIRYLRGDEGEVQYRVGAVFALAQKSHNRKRVFKGETAHMDAERFYGDIVHQVRYA